MLTTNTVYPDIRFDGEGNLYKGFGAIEGGGTFVKKFTIEKKNEMVKNAIASGRYTIGVFNNAIGRYSTNANARHEA